MILQYIGGVYVYLCMYVCVCLYVFLTQKYHVGVPQVLLDFIKTINQPNGCVWACVCVSSLLFYAICNPKLTSVLISSSLRLFSLPISLPHNTQSYGGT